MGNFGASWIPTLLGSIVIVLTWANQVFVEQGMPKDGKEWMAFLISNAAGLIGLVAKQFNVSNAPHPTTAAPVTSAEEAIAKPPTTATPQP
jgi:hypothetical protein